LRRLKKIGSVKGFSVDSKDPALDLAGKNLTGSASISLDLYVPEWKALWRENLHKARERMIEMFANMLGSAVNAIPAIILSGIGLVVFVVLLIVVIALCEKPAKRTSSKYRVKVRVTMPVWIKKRLGQGP